MRKQLERVASNLMRDTRSGRYYLDKNVEGKRYRHSLGTTDRRTAERVLSAKLSQLLAGRVNDARTLKFEALVKIFLESRRAKAAQTQATEQWMAKNLRATFQGGMGLPVCKIRTSHLLTWLNTQAQAAGWRNVTFNRHRLFLRQMFDLAVADRILTNAENPFVPRLIRAKKREKVVRNIPTPEQFAAIIADVRAQRDNGDREQSANFLEFLGCAGVGQAEAATLKLRDIVPQKIAFVRQKTGRPFTVPIYDWLAPVVQRQLALRGNAHTDAPLFTIKNAGTSLEHSCKRLGIPRFTQRNLRAMLVKRLYDAGVPVKRIALWQGHQDGGKLIQEIYTEVFCDTDSAAETADLARVQSSMLTLAA